jgi:hypothetical protein
MGRGVSTPEIASGADGGQTKARDQALSDGQRVVDRVSPARPAERRVDGARSQPDGDRAALLA